MGPPLHIRFITALPTDMFFVTAKTRCASWKMSVLRPISPCQCGTTGALWRFWIWVERWASATQATP